MARPYQQDCPIALSLDVIGERWTLLLIRDLFRLGPRRFQDFLDGQPGLAPTVLSARLKVLEEHGLVARRTYSSHPPRDEYLLTDKGRELCPVVIALRHWGARHYLDTALVHTACGHPVELTPTCPHCARAVQLTELDLETGQR
jgi:DNA-binding HxlR family transcriptional regulator